MVEFVRERGERGDGDGGVREEWGGAGVRGGDERSAGIGGMVVERGDFERERRRERDGERGWGRDGGCRGRAERCDDDWGRCGDGEGVLLTRACVWTIVHNL